MMGAYSWLLYNSLCAAYMCFAVFLGILLSGDQQLYSVIEMKN